MKMRASTATAESYAEAVCEGMNQFLGHNDDVEMVIAGIVPHGEVSTRVTLSMVPVGDTISDVAYEDPRLEYTVETNGEEVTFAGQDSQHVHIISDADDWDVFDFEDHVGEVVSCAIESGQ